MREDQWDRVKQLLERASAMPDADRRNFLEAECAGDTEVLAEVLSLLGHGSGGFLDRERLLSAIAGGSDEAPPDSVPGYELIRVLGSGGMGIVYLAEQEKPVRRTVAIKLIKAGMDTREVVRRFDAERQALAIMNHPSIARVYDAGASEDGRPYFVMEHVEGVPITRYCDDARLTLTQRLDLFVRTCEGVQHAHQKGIIHRDLKPSNVLVAHLDGAPVPKIIDFGIAKATDKDFFDRTVQTELGQVVGTIAYMSPEQARMTSQEIDTRTDVYSLGVILYELLVGSLPFDPRTQDTAFDEALRQIREVDPPLPSSRLKKLGDEAEEITRTRDTDAGSILRELRGDLDWIAMRALEKEPDRRYPSASELAADVGRYLRHEPVLARPPAAAYRVGKFVRRHRVGVASAAVLVLALLGGVAGTTVGLIRAREAEAAAKAEAASFEEMADYLVDMFESADPSISSGETVTVRDLLDMKSATIREELAGEPRALGRIMVAMGRSYRALGFHAQAIPLLEDALPILREEYGESPEVYNALNELANEMTQTGDYRSSIGILTQAAEMAERMGGPSHEDLPYIFKGIADAHNQLGNLDEARPFLERAIGIWTESDGESERLASVLGSLAENAWRSGDTETALETAQRALAMQLRASGPESESTGFAHFYLGEAQLAGSQYEAATRSYTSALEIFERIYPPGHANVGECHLNIARALAGLGHTGEAYEEYERARAIIEEAFPDQPETALMLAGFKVRFAELLEDLGRPQEAASTRREARSIRERLATAPALAPGMSGGTADEEVGG